MPTRVLIVDDHPLVREGLARVLDRESDIVTCGHCSTIPEAIDLVKSEKPHVAIIDLELGRSSGLELVQHLATENGLTRSLVFSMYHDTTYATRAVRSGASGYVSKSEPVEHLVECVRKVARGELAFREAVLARAVQGKRATSGEPEDILTERELQVFRLLGQGLPSGEIADRMSISLRTVYKHIEHIKTRLGISAGSSLIHYATVWVLRSRGGTGLEARPDSPPNLQASG